jgi:hypothetical protein
MAREETKARGVEGLPREASIVSDGQWWRWFQAVAVLVAAPPLFFFFFLFLCCFFSFLFSFSLLFFGDVKNKKK